MTDADPRAAALRLSRPGPGVVDAVAAEVFTALEHRERHLLLCTAHEPFVTDELATHLTADATAAQVLARLESTGLLVTRHEAELGGSADDVYFIHPILSEIARRRLRAGGVDVELARATVRRAVTLDLGSDQLDDVLARLMAIGDFDDAARVVGAVGTDLVARGRDTRCESSPGPTRTRRDP